MDKVDFFSNHTRKQRKSHHKSTSHIASISNICIIMCKTDVIKAMQRNNWYRQQPYLIV